MKLTINENSFGVISEFKSFELNLVQRNNFIVPSDRFKLSDDKIPVDGKFSNSNPEPVSLSRHFLDFNLMKFPINPVLTSETLTITEVNNEKVFVPRQRHHYSNKFVYSNLQRLCYEVLDPVVDFIGERPNIEHGLIFTTNTSDIDQDTFFADQTKGNAVVFNFSFDSSGEKIISCMKLISEFSLFDRMIYDNTLVDYDVPTLKVSVNENKRKIISRVVR